MENGMKRWIGYLAMTGGMAAVVVAFLLILQVWGEDAPVNAAASDVPSQGISSVVCEQEDTEEPTTEEPTTEEPTTEESTTETVPPEVETEDEYTKRY